MSPALCFRILQHLEELGLLKKGQDTVLDPMGGTGITNICAAAMGYQSISVELEEKFIGFQQQNKGYASRKLYRDLDWTILKGDARKLSELLNEKGLVSLTSPPYQDVAIGDGTIQRNRQIVSGRATELGINRKVEHYGTTEGQIGNLKDTPLKSIVSPPYGEALKDTGASRLKIRVGKGHASDYSDNEDNIGNQTNESYLEAMSKVYREISLVSDVLCVVIKNPTRKGHLRRLDLDSIAILEASNWKILCQHRALLFEELEQSDMFGGSKKQVKGRLSFFKRLAWRDGSPVASWEDVLIAVRA